MLAESDKISKEAEECNAIAKEAQAEFKSMIGEAERRRRLWRAFAWMLPVVAFAYARIIDGRPLRPGLPHLMASEWLSVAFILVVAAGTVAMFVGGGKSPAVRFDPSEIPVGLDDVDLGTVGDVELRRLVGTPAERYDGRVLE